MGAKTIQDLELSFDVGHSSIGWAVLQSSADVSPAANAPRVNLLGCGVVTFGADDCLASKRRDYRRQRRHARATRQRIEQMERLLGHLGVIKPAELEAKHNQAGGHSMPWLLAARVLASQTAEEKKAALLNWNELWNVLRWYAHNRGYDGNIRWSGDFRVEAFAEKLAASSQDLEAQAEEVAESETESEGGEGGDSDSDKLAAGAKLMEGYGFETATFAETTAKILLGPERAVKLGQPGKPGKLEDVDKSFTEDEFRNKLFGLTDEFKNHPTHLKNYFKGIRAAFPRKVIKEIDGKRTLVGGTEWEVRYILRAHFGHLPDCDAVFERAICGSMPETKYDWRAYDKSHSALYLSSDADKQKLRELCVPRKADKQAKLQKKKDRAKFLSAKLVLPQRYEGGLLFGQLGTRFHNRIISTCRFSYARIAEAVLKKDEKVLAQYGTSLDAVLKSRRKSGEEIESDDALARRWATKLAKVPTKISGEFLRYRWATKLADLMVKRPGQEKLTGQERHAIHEQMKAAGYLTRDELGDAIKKATLGREPANLEQMFDATPEAADALVIDPVRKFLATNAVAQAVCRVLDRKLTVRLARKLRKRTVKIREIESWLSTDAAQRFLQSLESYVRDQNTAEKKAKRKKVVEPEEEAEEKAPSKRKKKMLTLESVRSGALKASLPAGRAPYHRVILRQAFDEIMAGNDPRRAKFNSANPEGEKKIQDGQLFQTPEINRTLIGGATDNEKAGRIFAQWKTHWLTHEKNRERYEAREKLHAGMGEKFLVSEYQVAASQSWLSRQTNNHIVRHRLIILERLVRDIINDKQLVQDGDEKRIGKISIEVVRDILAFSGMTRKQLTGRTMPSLKAHHEYIVKKLKKDLEGTQWEYLADSGGLIKKAKIADDLGWRCPYTGQPYCACDLASGKMDLDHVIPKSRRLTDAMESLVVTYKAINNVKGDLTAWEFVDKFQGQKIDGVHQPIRQIWDYERFVKNKDNDSDKLRLSGETGHKDYPRWPRTIPGSMTKKHPDFIRRKKRRQYLLIKHYEKDKNSFAPRDLTITSHLNRLAQQVLLRTLPHILDHEITSIPGSVTGALRDTRGWGLLGCLDGAASADVMRMKKWFDPQTNQTKDIRVAKPKGEIRKLTHLHHALDACVIGIVSNLLRNKDGKLWELAAKRELNEQDVKSFEALREKYQKQWPPFDIHTLFQIVDNHDKDGNPPKHDHKWRLQPMPLKKILPEIKNEIRNRLKERRVVEHVPVDMLGMAAEETVWRVFDPNDPHPSAKRLRGWFEQIIADGKIKKLLNPADTEEESVLIVCRKRRDAKGNDKGKPLYDTGNIWRWIYEEMAKTKLIGLTPTIGSQDKLKSNKGVKQIGNNYGVAILDHAKAEEEKLVIIPWHKVWHRIQELKTQNGGKQPRILRNGMLIRIGKFHVRKPTRVLENSLWMVQSAGDFEGVIKVDLKPFDVVKTRYEGVDPKDPTGKKTKSFTTAGCKLNTDLKAVYDGGLEILKTSLTGIASCPITSSA